MPKKDLKHKATSQRCREPSQGKVAKLGVGLKGLTLRMLTPLLSSRSVLWILGLTWGQQSCE
jgi:hypothetical protein